MSGLAIPPHPRRLNGFAVAGLMLLAAGSFGSGFLRETSLSGPSSFPPAQAPSPDAQPLAAASDAAAAPALQLAEHEPRRAPAAASSPPASDTVTEAAAPTPPAADVSANVPDPALPPEPPRPESQPPAEPEIPPT